MLKQKHSLAILTLVILSFLLAIPFGNAAESPTCDEGDIKNVSILVDGVWYLRPDSRIDNLPLASSLGPFAVRADLENWSTIVNVQLTYGLSHKPMSTVPMVIDVDNNTRYGSPFNQRKGGCYEESD